MASAPLTPPKTPPAGVSSSTICLCMIVKDEAKVIERCLASVRPVISHWIVVDTGSSDGTQEIVRKYMKDLPGELVEEPWQDFAHNRSQALKLSRGKADFSLIIDADDVLELPQSLQMPGKGLPKLDADGYNFGITLGNVSYERMQLVNNKKDWCYRGVLHEFLHCNDGEFITERLPWTINCSPDGQRRCNPSTYKRDAELLERTLMKEEDPFLRSRYTFYLAQSWRDCGEHAKALEAYQKRTKMGYWTEEVYYSLLQLGRQQIALKYDNKEVLKTFALATATCPHRAEAAHDAARLCRTANQFEEGYTLATLASRIAGSKPAHGLFVENWIYDYGLKDELSIHAYWTDRFKESLQVSIDLLGHPELPSSYRERVAANARFALAKLSKS